MTRRTVARSAEVAGIGLHTGAACRVRLIPAGPGSGITFVRDGRRIPARLAHVVDSERRTTLGTGAHRVETVEHLLAAVFAAGVEDLTVEVEGPEVPILDGSFGPFVTLLERAGAVDHDGASTLATIGAPFELALGGSRYQVAPAPVFEIAVSLEYAMAVIGNQSYECVLTEPRFRNEISAARTYGFLAEVEALQTRGLLRGASDACAVVLSDEAVLNTTLRWPDEFARHKLGDLVGDLALLGTRLAMRIVACRPSHSGNIACARAITAVARYLEAS